MDLASKAWQWCEADPVAIAEEVAEAFPDLAVRNDAGGVDTVHYETLSVLLLNEVQKQQAAMQHQQAEIETQRTETQRSRSRIEALERRLNAILASSGALTRSAELIARFPIRRHVLARRLAMRRIIRYRTRWSGLARRTGSSRAVLLVVLRDGGSAFGAPDRRLRAREWPARVTRRNRDAGDLRG